MFEGRIKPDADTVPEISKLAAALIKSVGVRSSFAWSTADGGDALIVSGQAAAGNGVP